MNERTHNFVFTVLGTSVAACGLGVIIGAGLRDAGRNAYEADHCVPALYVAAPDPGGLPVSTADVCGVGRVPGAPEVRDGLLVVECSCPK